MMHLTSTRHQGTPIRFLPATTLTKRTSGSGCHRLQGLHYSTGCSPPACLRLKVMGQVFERINWVSNLRIPFLRIKAISDGNL